jgi:hypothetical protein
MAARRSVVAASTSRAFSTSRPARQILGEGDQALFDKHVVKGKRITVVDFHADVRAVYFAVKYRWES